MTKAASIQSFMSSFGWSAYPEEGLARSGSEKPEYPYITYSSVSGGGYDRISVTAQLWYRGEKWSELNAKSEQIAQYIGDACMIPCDNGGIIIRKGDPYCQTMGDEYDNMVKRKVLNIVLTFITTY